MDEAKKTRGGARPGAGRKPEGDESTVVVPIRLRPKQKAQLKELGGSKWVRDKLDEEGKK